MAETTGIAWCRSTFNPHIGCTKISPGCDGCYAAVSTPARALGVRWGSGEPRRRTSAANWRKPLAWNKRAEREAAEGVMWNGRPGFWPVFCASLADVFDNEVPQAWRDDLFALIDKTPRLTWLLVTKRIGNVASMVPSIDWLLFHDNVRILITVVNQEEADRDIPKLLELRCKNGVSYEPALSAVDWAPWLIECESCHVEGLTAGGKLLQHHTHGRRILDWIICGGESSQAGHRARPFNIEWARSTIQQCRQAEVPVFVKQLGSASFEEGCAPGHVCVGKNPQSLRRLEDRSGADPLEWPMDIRVREFPI